MNGSTPALSAVVEELLTAIRRDHGRRIRRRKLTRLAGASLLALAALSSAALAAGGAFRTVDTVTPVSEVQLPSDITIKPVDSFPEFVGTASPTGFVTRTAGGKWGNYIYHVTGGEAPELGCGAPAVPTNNDYITSTRPLTEAEIRSLLQPNGELIAPKDKPRPPWITSTSDGCPNPGQAGQPGTPGVEPLAVKSSVEVPASSTRHILVRRVTKVPIGAESAPGGERPAGSGPGKPPASAATPGSAASQDPQASSE